jgi:hypothetical protein
MNSWLNGDVMTLRNTGQTTATHRSLKDLLFFVVVGLGAGATLVAFAFVRQSQVAALAFPGALWVAMLAFRVSRQFWAEPGSEGSAKPTATYLVIVALVLISTGLVTGMAIRGNSEGAPLAWLLGVLVFVVIASGFYVTSKRTVRSADSDK